jgi:hypothetical protein
LKYKKSAQHADAIRLFAIRAVEGLCCDRHISQILGKLDIGKKLTEQIQSPPVLEGNSALHMRFCEHAFALITHSFSHAGGGSTAMPGLGFSTLAASGLLPGGTVVQEGGPHAMMTPRSGYGAMSSLRRLKDPILNKLTHAAIVANTTISFDEGELLLLIRNYLQDKGLSQTAGMLELEGQAKLTIGDQPHPAPPGVALHTMDDGTVIPALLHGTTPSTLGKKLKFGSDNSGGRGSFMATGAGERSSPTPQSPLKIALVGKGVKRKLSLSSHDSSSSSYSPAPPLPADPTTDGSVGAMAALGDGAAAAWQWDNSPFKKQKRWTQYTPVTDFLLRRQPAVLTSLDHPALVPSSATKKVDCTHVCGVVCVCVCTCCMYTCTHMSVYVHMFVRVHYVYVYITIHMYVYVIVYAYVYVCVCVCMYVCMYMHNT